MRFDSNRYGHYVEKTDASGERTWLYFCRSLEWKYVSLTNFPFWESKEELLEALALVEES